MEDLVNNLFNRDSKAFFDFISNFFNGIFDFYYNNQPALEDLALIISGFLIFFIGFYIIKLDIIKTKMDRYSEIFGADISKTYALRAWLKILKRLETKSPIQLRLVVTECEKIFDEAMKISGIKGKSMDERLEQLNEAEVENLKDIMEAHNVGKRIKDEPDFEVSYDQTKHIAKIYKKTFQDFGLLD